MPIKALGLYQNDWTLKVRLLKKGEKRTFVKKEGESSLLPLEFIDFEGTQISATLFGLGVEKYESMLMANKCYLVSCGNVKLANKKFTSIKFTYSLTLDANSKIQDIPDDPSIPKGGFDFIKISEVCALNVGSMIDVIGVISAVGEETKIITKRDGKELEKKQITICDDSNHSIDLTLWAAKAKEEFKEGEIIAIKGVKVGEFNGKNLSALPDTGIFREPDDERTKELKIWLDDFHIILGS